MGGGEIGLLAGRGPSTVLLAFTELRQPCRCGWLPGAPRSSAMDNGCSSPALPACWLVRGRRTHLGPMLQAAATLLPDQPHSTHPLPLQAGRMLLTRRRRAGGRASRVRRTTTAGCTTTLRIGAKWGGCGPCGLPPSVLDATLAPSTALALGFWQATCMLCPIMRALCCCWCRKPQLSPCVCC